MERLYELLSLLKPDRILLLKDESVPDPLALVDQFHVNRLLLHVLIEKVGEKSNSVISEFRESIKDVHSGNMSLSLIKLKIEEFLKEYNIYKDRIINNDLQIGLYHYTVMMSIYEAPYQLLEKYTYDSLPDIYRDYFNRYFQLTDQTTKKILSNCEILLDSYKSEYYSTHSGAAVETTASEKIKLNLSVGDIALLFRLLVEAKYIEPDNKSKLFRAISSTFASMKAEEISFNSLNKKFHDPDTSSRNELDIILTNLRLELKKIE